MLHSEIDPGEEKIVIHSNPSAVHPVIRVLTLPAFGALRPGLESYLPEETGSSVCFGANFIRFQNFNERWHA
jgi:hypothetical protein